MVIDDQIAFYAVGENAGDLVGSAKMLGVTVIGESMLAQVESCLACKNLYAQGRGGIDYQKTKYLVRE